MFEFSELSVSELEKTQGGFDPVSWGLGFLLGSVVNDLTEAATGKSVGGWVAEGVKTVGDSYKTADFRYTQPLYGNW